MNKILLIYHGDCPDGFMAATIFRKATNQDAAEIKFYAGIHQQPPPDVTGQDVVFVDFSYRRPVICEMAGQAKSILIVDHHVSAQRIYCSYEFGEPDENAFNGVHIASRAAATPMMRS